MPEIVSVLNAHGGRQSDKRPLPWRHALLAGLPGVMIALLHMPGLLGTFDVLELPRGLEFVFLAAFGLPTVAALVVALHRGWPLWSAGWAAFWLAAALVPLLHFFSFALLVVGLPLILMALIFALTRCDPTYATIAALPFMMIFWLFASEFTIQEVRQPLWLLAWLLAGLLTAYLARDARPGRAVWLLLGFNALLGLAVIVARTYFHHVPLMGGPPDEPSLMKVITRFVPNFLLSASILLAPLTAWLLSQLARIGHPASRYGYWLSLLGLILIPAAYAGPLFWYWSSRPTFFPGTLASTALAAAGLLLYAGGILLMAHPLRRQRLLYDRRSTFTLLLAPLAFPLALLLHLVDEVRIPPVGMALGLEWLDRGPQLPIFAGAIIWLLLAAWLVTNLHVRRFNEAPVGGG